jgi:hypothetical protein
MTAPNLSALRALAEKATAGPWRSLRDGNQYVNTSYIPTANLVGASRIEGLVRPWNPHAYVAFGFKPAEFETVRFVDEDADYIAALSPSIVLTLLSELEQWRAIAVPGCECWQADLRHADPDRHLPFCPARAL